MSRVGEAIREEQEQQIVENEQEFNMFERQAILDAIHYAQVRETLSQRFSKDETKKKNYIKSNDDNKRGDKYSQIIINNLHRGFNPLQVVLIGKDYNTTFSEKSINFVDVFSNNSGSEMLIDKTNNKLILNNFISQITSNKNVTSQFTRAQSQNHVIIKIIILYDLEYNW